MYRPVLVTAPTETAVSLVEAKRQIRADDFSDDDDYITSLIAAATAYLDGWTGVLGRCVMPQTWRQDYDCFERCMRLPLFPVISVTTVAYDDVDGVSRTIDSANYALLNDDMGAYIKFKQTYGFAAINVERPAVHITYQAGHASDAPELQTIKALMLILIAQWYENRSAISADQIQQIPFAADALIASLRRNRV
jgi:uncharacterized phiE125 gp8 family phage protein